MDAAFALGLVPTHVFPNLRSATSMAPQLKHVGRDIHASHQPPQRAHSPAERGDKLRSAFVTHDSRLTGAVPAYLLNSCLKARHTLPGELRNMPSSRRAMAISRGWLLREPRDWQGRAVVPPEALHRPPRHCRPQGEPPARHGLASSRNKGIAAACEQRERGHSGGLHQRVEIGVAPAVHGL